MSEEVRLGGGFNSLKSRKTTNGLAETLKGSPVVVQSIFGVWRAGGCESGHCGWRANTRGQRRVHPSLPPNLTKEVLDLKKSKNLRLPPPQERVRHFGQTRTLPSSANFGDNLGQDPENSPLPPSPPDNFPTRHLPVGGLVGGLGGWVG